MAVNDKRVFGSRIVRMPMIKLGRGARAQISRLGLQVARVGASAALLYRVVDLAPKPRGR